LGGLPSDVNRPKNGGDTPLHCAVMSGYGRPKFDPQQAIETVKVLLGADNINVAQHDNYGITALSKAARHESICPNVAKVYEFIKSHPKFLDSDN